MTFKFMLETFTRCLVIALALPVGAIACAVFAAKVFDWWVMR